MNGAGIYSSFQSMGPGALPNIPSDPSKMMPNNLCYSTSGAPGIEM